MKTLGIGLSLMQLQYYYFYYIVFIYFVLNFQWRASDMDGREYKVWQDGPVLDFQQPAAVSIGRLRNTRAWGLRLFRGVGSYQVKIERRLV